MSSLVGVAMSSACIRGGMPSSWAPVKQENSVFKCVLTKCHKRFHMPLKTHVTKTPKHI
jgi:hypothetical protein